MILFAIIAAAGRLRRVRATQMAATVMAEKKAPLPLSTRPMQFGLRTLLIAVALCAAALGTGRWLYTWLLYRPHFEVIVQATETSGAMEPTLGGREILVADTHAYRKAKPARWDIVVFRPVGDLPKTASVLRVIGLPGETVSFSEGKVVIDGQPVVPPTHLQNLRFHCDFPDAKLVPHPYTVPKRCYYLLGDNPDKANDSRLWGALAEAEILGRYPAGDGATAQR